MKLPRALSEIEETFALQLRTDPTMAGFVRQYQPLPPPRRIRLDFAYPVVRFGIEVDGAVHRTKEHFHGDRQRDLDLAVAGWFVVRLSRPLVFSGKGLDACRTILQRMVRTQRPLMEVGPRGMRIVDPERPCA